MDLPPIFLLASHIAPEELHELEEKIPSLTYDVTEAEVIIGKITRRERALFELRRLGFHIKEDQHESSTAKGASTTPNASDTGRAIAGSKAPKTVKVVKLKWLLECLDLRKTVPIQDFIVYEGTVQRRADAEVPTGSSPTTLLKRSHSILERAFQDDNNSSTVIMSKTRRSHHTSSSQAPPPPPLLNQTTSVEEALPEVPDYLCTTYSCQRPTFAHSPNEYFVGELVRIRFLRLLKGDQVGVRAYSSSISALASYPYKVKSPRGAFFSPSLPMFSIING